MRPLLFILSYLILAPVCAGAQPWSDPHIASEGKYHPRHEFVSFTTRPMAEKGDVKLSPHYLPLTSWDIVKEKVDNPKGGNSASLDGLIPPQLPAGIAMTKYRTILDVPYLWLDRDVFLHVEGLGQAHALYINDKKVGYSEDGRTPAEYKISGFVTNGLNAIRLEVYDYSTGSWLENAIPLTTFDKTGNIYVYSQPKIRIDDFAVTTKYDDEGKNAMVYVTAVLSNSYRSPEKAEFLYDIFMADGTRHMTEAAEVEIPGESTLRVSFMTYVYPSAQKRWSPETPYLYDMLLFMRLGQRTIEYIPFKFGLNETQLRDGQLYINRKPANLNAVNYNAAANEAQTRKEMLALKKQKFNTICVDYPQPRWFYELCDSIGFYVIDQANNNSGYRTADRSVGGSTANNKDFLSGYIDRVSNMQGRSKNYTSVIATSMGGESGNGYNMYKAYEHLKAIDSLHVVTYRDPQGEWNCDIPFPAAANSK